jgi:hypothetical protein
MTQQQSDHALSTADMVSATEGPQPSERSDSAVTGDQQSTGGGMRALSQATGTQEPNGRATPPAGNGLAGQAPTPAVGPASTPPVPAEQAASYRSRWEDIQTGFVDEPRRAVEQADQLVAEVIKRVAEVFAEERGKLETQWSRGEQVDTEQLRVALKRYRSFFERLLSA